MNCKLLKLILKINIKQSERLSILIDKYQLWNNQDVINWQDDLNKISVKYNQYEETKT